MKKTFTLVALMLSSVFTFGQNIKNDSIAYYQGNTLLSNVTMDLGATDAYANVRVCNTDSTVSLPAYKLRIFWQTSREYLQLAPTAEQDMIPAGWEITYNGDIGTTGNKFELHNGTDQIPPNTCRDIKIKVTPIKVTPPDGVQSNTNLGWRTQTNPLFGPPPIESWGLDDNTNLVYFIQVPTPITISQFDVYTDKCDALISWTTTKESNVEKLIIEESVDGINYEAIKELSPKGFNGEGATYTFTDKNNKPGLHIYRIKNIDSDGKFAYSKAMAVQMKCTSSDIKVYPNPTFNDNVNLEITPEAPGAFKIIVSDMVGRVISKETVDLKGSTILPISLQGQAAGMYLIQVVSSNDKQVFKVQKS